MKEQKSKNQLIEEAKFVDMLMKTILDANNVEGTEALIAVLTKLLNGQRIRFEYAAIRNHPNGQTINGIVAKVGLNKMGIIREPDKKFINVSYMKISGFTVSNRPKKAFYNASDRPSHRIGEKIAKLIVEEK